MLLLIEKGTIECQQVIYSNINRLFIVTSIDYFSNIYRLFISNINRLFIVTLIGYL